MTPLSVDGVKYCVIYSNRSLPDFYTVFKICYEIFSHYPKVVHYGSI